MSATAAPAAAYHRCEAITRHEAANFYYGIRLLPPDKRRAMCAVYAFARRVDDIGDGSLPAAEKLARLDAELELLARLGQDTDDAVALALADASRRFPLPPDAFRDLIEGVRMDVLETTYERFDELLVYCRRVAGSIGRLCLSIFGARELETAVLLADDLGVAMQLTNILRDVREDAGRGRVYLPAEDLARLGWAPDTLLSGLNGHAPAGAAELVRFEAERARDWFTRGMQLVPLLDRRSAACVTAMTGIYRRLLDRIEEQPEEVLRQRLSLPVWEKAWVAVRSVAGVAT